MHGQVDGTNFKLAFGIVLGVNGVGLPPLSLIDDWFGGLFHCSIASHLHDGT